METKKTIIESLNSWIEKTWTEKIAYTLQDLKSHHHT